MLPRARLRSFVNQYSFSTRCRNRTVAAALQRAAAAAANPGSGPVLLDVGCGPYGVSAHLDGVPTLGVDTLPEEAIVGDFAYRRASVTDLPFDDASFPLVSCVDVIEHLPLDARARAVEELVRVTGRVLVLAFPHGARARARDQALHDDCVRRGVKPPDWVVEHLRQRHPGAEEIGVALEEAARKLGRPAACRVRYCEPLRLGRMLQAASTNRFFYVAASVGLGLALPLLPAPAPEAAYRAVWTVEFEDGATRPAGARVEAEAR